MTEVIMLPEEYQELLAMNNKITNTENAIQTLRETILQARNERRKLLDRTRHRNRYYNNGGKEKKRLYFLTKKRSVLIEQGLDLSEPELFEIETLANYLN